MSIKKKQQKAFAQPLNNGGFVYEQRVAKGACIGAEATIGKDERTRPTE